MQWCKILKCENISVLSSSVYWKFLSNFSSIARSILWGGFKGFLRGARSPIGNNKSLTLKCLLFQNLQEKYSCICRLKPTNFNMPNTKLLKYIPNLDKVRNFSEANLPNISPVFFLPLFLLSAISGGIGFTIFYPLATDCLNFLYTRRPRSSHYPFQFFSYVYDLFT